MAQPVLGLIASAIVMVISLGYISLFDFGTFVGWVSFFALCFIPFSVMTGVIWGGNPPFVAGMKQPAKGLVLLALTLAVGAVVSQVVFRTIGAGQGAPGPQLAFFSICVIVTTFFWTIAFGGWPLTAMTKNPVAGGLLTWAGCYVVGYVIFRTFCNFDFLQGAPIYVAASDPHGLFNGWNVVTFYMVALLVLFVILNFDLWPFTSSPAVMKQPTLGIVLVGTSLVVGYAIYYVAVYSMGMDVVQTLLRVSIAPIFGTILMLNMMQNSLYAKLAQPARGVANIVTATIIGTILMAVYQMVEPSVTAPIPAGPPGYELEVWTANAMLSVTFPFLVIYAAYLKVWPLARPLAAAAPAKEPVRA